MLMSAAARKCSLNIACAQKIKAGKEEHTNLSYCATFWKTEERFPAASLLSCKNKRKHTNLRIQPQEGEEVGSRRIHTKLGKISDIRRTDEKNLTLGDKYRVRRRCRLFQM